jgi:hypothetical protein
MAAGPWGGHSNGYIPLSALTPLSWSGLRLRSDAAAAFEQLNVLFRARFGMNIVVTDAYRDYATQVRLKAEKPTLAATPGTSNHGWAMAVDLGGTIDDDYENDQYKWMDATAPAFGWVNPGWARPGPAFEKREPWHWEFGGSAGSTPTNPTNPPEDDMPLNQTDLEAIDRLIVDRLAQRLAQGTTLSPTGLDAVRGSVLGLMRAEEFQLNDIAGRVLNTKIDASTGTVAQTLRDARIISRRHEQAWRAHEGLPADPNA